MRRRTMKRKTSNINKRTLSKSVTKNLRIVLKLEVISLSLSVFQSTMTRIIEDSVWLAFHGGDMSYMFYS